MRCIVNNDKNQMKCRYILWSTWLLQNIYWKINARYLRRTFAFLGRPCFRLCSAVLLWSTEARSISSIWWTFQEDIYIMPFLRSSDLDMYSSILITVNEFLELVKDLLLFIFFFWNSQSHLAVIFLRLSAIT